MFMIDWIFLILASRNSMVCVLSFDPTNNVPFFFLYTTQESKKCTKFENIVNPSSNNVIIELMKI